MSPFVGLKLFDEAYDESNPEHLVVDPVTFDQVIVGYGLVHEMAPPTWVVNRSTAISNHPKWGTSWPTKMLLPTSTGENHVEDIPADWDQLEELVEKIADLSQNNGDVFDKVSKKLFSIYEEMDNVRISSTDSDNFGEPENGWFVTMKLSSHIDEGCRFEALLFPDIIYMLFHTVKRLNAIGRLDLFHAFDKESFIRLHQELAIFSTIESDIECGSLASLLHSCTRNIKIEEVMGIFSNDVIVEYGGHKEAMTKQIK